MLRRCEDNPQGVAGVSKEKEVREKEEEEKEKEREEEEEEEEKEVRRSECGGSVLREHVHPVHTAGPAVLYRPVR